MCRVSSEGRRLAEENIDDRVVGCGGSGLRLPPSPPCNLSGKELPSLAETAPMRGTHQVRGLEVSLLRQRSGSESSGLRSKGVSSAGTRKVAIVEIRDDGVRHMRVDESCARGARRRGTAWNSENRQEASETAGCKGTAIRWAR